ncbi:uncharacterized protein LOC123513235 isoform X1 [Portunus trituberculatus]|uniref:uncharacterized protein LOC123513235 isoform X1 n=1 Tax=Portunus trituberculatus TaxID=210409 RepID=UPI001E1CF156|nr:uncharacterized protein LOC123513235 isoform X1 [Portunus trituberculatus]
MTSLPNVTATTTESLSVAEHLSQESHMLDVTVWLMIFCIFTFFFIIIVASICMHWMEVRSYHRSGGMVVIPQGPVPACVTLLSSSQPHVRLLEHYHPHPFYGAHVRCFDARGNMKREHQIKSSSQPVLPVSL